MASIDRVEARFYSRDGGAYVCGLCPHGCRIRPGQYGRCGSRRGDEDMLVACTYGKVSSLCVDPMEKKPLFHYRPGGRCFSVGSVGCNMSCRHCQNYAISMLPSGRRRTTYESPSELAAMCRHEGQDVIAFTYNEPMIWHEYIMDVAEADPGLRMVMVTNGLASEGPMREMCGVTEAMNIDVKGFTDEFYMRVCGAHLQDVLDSVVLVHGTGVHVELTYLVIPGVNDSDREVTAFCEWVRDEVSPEVPVHFTRFHPDNEMTDVQWTPVETVLGCRGIGLDCGLPYVYVGNTVCEGAEDTVCSECGAVAVRRLGYLVDSSGVRGSACARCGHDLGIVWRGAIRVPTPGRGPRSSARRTGPRGSRGPPRRPPPSGPPEPRRGPTMPYMGRVLRYGPSAPATP